MNNSWIYGETGPAGRLEHGAACGSSGEFGGLWVRDRFDVVGGTPPSTTGYWRITAPPATSIADITYSRFLHSYDDPDWRVELRTTAGSVLEQCHPANDGDTCDLGVSGGGGVTFDETTSPAAFPAAGLEMGIRCVATTICVNGGTLHAAQTVLYGASVTISDPQGPTVGSLSGSLVAGGWLRGSHTVAMTGADAVGIKRLDLTRDGGAALRSTAFSCDYTYTTPCQLGTVNSAWADVNTALLSDGTHTIVGSAIDSANNRTDTSQVVVRTDNTAPAAPLAVAADSGWSNDATRDISWTLPGQQAAPITGATIRLCPPGGGACTTAAAESATSGEVTLNVPGVWTGSVFLSDAAGNSNPSNAAPFTLRYDPDPPAAPPALDASGEWTNESPQPVTWSLPAGQLAPIVGATIRLCPPAGSPCTTAPAATTTSGTVSLTEAGTWTGGVFLTDEAGNVAPANAAPFTLRYDAGAPPAPALGTPQQQGATSQFVVAVTPNDPGPAPVEKLGADLCRTDGSACNTVAPVSLSEVRFVAPGSGTWRGRVRAIDEAGNVGSWGTVVFTFTPAATPTPTPTASPTPTPSPTASPSPSPTSSPTPSAATSVEPTVSPSPTPTVTARRNPGLVLARAQLRGRRLTVHGRVAPDATGRVTVTVRAKGRARVRAADVVTGSFRTSVRLPKGAVRARVVARYGGDRAYLPATVRRLIERSSAA